MQYGKCITHCVSFVTLNMFSLIKFNVEVKNINKTDTFCIYPPFFLSCSFYSPAISFNVNVTVIQWYAFFRKLKYKVSRKPLKVILSVCINDDIS